MNFDCYGILAHPSNNRRRGYTESVPAGDEKQTCSHVQPVIMDGRTEGEKQHAKGNTQPEKKRNEKVKKRKQIPRLLTDEIDSHLGAATPPPFFEGNCQRKITR